MQSIFGALLKIPKALGREVKNARAKMATTKRPDGAKNHQPEGPPSDTSSARNMSKTSTSSSSKKAASAKASSAKRAASGAKGSAVKKAAPKKAAAPAKKAAVKKAAPAKAPAKKAAVKKASPAKAPAKKAAVKQAPPAKKASANAAPKKAAPVKAAAPAKKAAAVKATSAPRPAVKEKPDPRIMNAPPLPSGLSVDPDSELTPQQAGFLYSELIAKRDSVLQGHSRHISAAIGEGEPMAEEMDMAQRHTEQAFNMRFADKERKLLREIENALVKFGTGEYGLCEGTGEPISFRRLEIRPWTRYSVEYKEQIELEKRQHR